MPDSVAPETLSVQRRRLSRREEWDMHVRLVSLMERYIDRKSVFWSSVENRPMSRMSGVFQRLRQVRPGLPDLMLIARGLPPVFLELKSRSGVASAAQKKIAAELVAAGCSYSLARSCRAALACRVSARGGASAQMETAEAARAVGRAFRKSACAAAAASRGGARACGCTTEIARAQARARRCAAGGGATSREKCWRRYGIA
jgi:hypothetical protein